MTQLSTLMVQQHTAAQTVVVASLSPLPPQKQKNKKMTIESTVSALSGPANGALPSKLKRKPCKLLFNWYKRISPYARCTLFRIIYQHSNVYKICIHPSKSPTPMKTRFLTLRLRLRAEGANSLSHGAIASLESAVTS